MSTLSPSITGIRGRVLRRGQEGYEHLRRGAVWHSGVPERYPAIIVFASSADDVAAAVELARKEGLSVAIRSGGHSWSGSHLRDDSLLIDLSNLRDVRINAEERTAVVQPGLRGSELLGMLREQGLFFPVGHNYGVGIGGYLLQGGFGWAGREYGPACGSVIGIDVVTADGRLVHASETENAELLWAARGSGPGFFAAVTAFHLRLHPHRPVTMRSSYILPGALAEDACRFLHEVGAGTRTEMGLLIQRHEIAGFEPVVVLGAIAYAETEEEAREQLAFMESCPLRDQALVAELCAPTVHGEQELDDSTSVLNEDRRWIADNIATSAGFEQLRPGLSEVVATLPAAPSYLLVFNWDGHPAAAARPPMAFSLEGEFCYALYTAWDSPAGDDEHREWTTERMRAWAPHAWGTMLADENLVNRPSRFVSDDALDRLDELRRIWDPEGAFVSWLGQPEPRSR
ncbi:FAD-binding oxidoreductase [Rathayibacter caricis]|uniref:FAD-binding oxidoreductase n=1 Tax=Rathayibacter caricis TaxID=110936 RepID=UPI001FB26FEA|nr:FAD-binding oxidoreductase [Rathayibacter caricis]MCJ1697746.1 FAD-binding oxidoreductase [Rathayibacter caricis]